MTLIASLLFITVIAVSFYTISASLKSSASRVEEIIQSREIAYASNPKIRIGKIKHFRTSAKIASAPTHIEPFAVNLTRDIDKYDNRFNQAA